MPREWLKAGRNGSAASSGYPDDELRGPLTQGKEELHTEAKHGQRPELRDHHLNWGSGDGWPKSGIGGGANRSSPPSSCGRSAGFSSFLPPIQENHPPPPLGGGASAGTASNTGEGTLTGASATGALVLGPGMSTIGTGAGGGAVIRVSRMPTPSIMASSTPPKAADLAAERIPVRSCRKPPVKAPAAMLFHGSSVHSNCGERDLDKRVR